VKHEQQDGKGGVTCINRSRSLNKGKVVRGAMVMPMEKKK
jgi:hypothetical protein